MKMAANAGEMLRLTLFIIGAAFVVQVPVFFALLKLTEFGNCDNVFPRSDQTLLWGSSNYSGLKVGIESPNSTEIVEEVPPQEKSPGPPSFKPLSIASYPFVLFSVYRNALDSFYVLGITSVVVRRHENDRPVYRCEWLPRNGSQISYDQAFLTEAQMLYVSFDENGMPYVPAIVNCTFNQSVAVDGEGGLLRLHLSNGPRNWDPHYVIEDVFQEKPKEVERIRLVEESELPHKYAFCGPPMYGTMNKDWIANWLAYHHYLWGGKAHFYFYDVGEIHYTAREMLEPWMKAGLLTIIDGFGGDSYPSWYRNQLLFINDCIYRTRFAARWTFFHDLDELLYIPAPNSLDSLLEENRDAPWMTFANMPFSSGHCRLPESPHEWQLERLMWRNKQPECMHDNVDPWMCLAAPGRRKYVVNPRKVSLSGVHRVALPGEGGVNFHGSIARVHHFHDALNPRANVCGILVNLSQNHERPSSDSYDFDNSIAALVPKARAFAGPLLSARHRQLF